MVTPGSTTTDLNGATDVTIVAAPAGSTKRVVLSVRVYNRDTAVVTITFQLDTSTVEREIEKRTGLAVAGFWEPITAANKLILDSTKSLEMFMGGAAATTNPVVHVNWIDIS